MCRVRGRAVRGACSRDVSRVLRRARRPLFDRSNGVTGAAGVALSAAESRVRTPANQLIAGLTARQLARPRQNGVHKRNSRVAKAV